MNLLNSVYSLLTSLLLVSLGSPPTLAVAKVPVQVIAKGTSSLPEHVLPANTPLPKKAFAPPDQQYYLNFDTSLEDIPSPDKDAKTMGSYYEQGTWEPLFPGSLRAKRSSDQTFNDNGRRFSYSKPDILFNMMTKMSDDLNGRDLKYPIKPFSKNSQIRTYLNLDEDDSTNTRYNLLPNTRVNVLPAPFQQANPIQQQQYSYLPLSMYRDKSFYDYDVFSYPIASKSEPETFLYPKSSKSSIFRTLPLSYDYIPKRTIQPSLFDSDYVREERQSTYPTQALNQQLSETNLRSKLNKNNEHFINFSKGILLLENFLNDGYQFLDFLKEVIHLEQQNGQNVFDNYENFDSLKKHKMLSLKNQRSKREATTSSLSLNDISKLLELLKSLRQYVQIAKDIIHRLPPGAQEVIEEAQEFVKNTKNTFINKFQSKLKNIDSISKLISAFSSFREKRGIRDGNIDQHERTSHKLDNDKNAAGIHGDGVRAFNRLYKRDVNDNIYRFPPGFQEAHPELKEFAHGSKNLVKTDLKATLKNIDVDSTLKSFPAVNNFREKRGIRDGDIDQHDRSSHHLDFDSHAIYKRDSNHNAHRFPPGLQEVLSVLKEVAQKLKNHFKSEWKGKLKNGDNDFILKLIAAVRSIRGKRGIRDGDIDQRERTHRDGSRSSSQVHERKSNDDNANTRNPYVPDRPFYAGQLRD